MTDDDRPTLDQVRAELDELRAENRDLLPLSLPPASPPGTSAPPPLAPPRDLFCDKSVRLWFCTVGSATKATWKQLA